MIHVLELFAARYPVDADRVFLFGYSMGAMDAYTIGAHYPNLWAGIIAVSGRANYYLWQELDKSKVEPYKRRLIDTEFGAEMTANYANLPILMYHGATDRLVNVEQPRRLLESLKGLHADATLNELPGRDHWIMSDVLADDAIFKWMHDRKRNPRPAEFDFTTHSIKYRRSHWVTVLDFARWGEPARVQAKLSADKSELVVKTENVASLRLDLSSELVGARAQHAVPLLTVKINGREHKIEKAGVATFEVEKTKPAGALVKTPQLCGPVKEAYAGRFLIVAGVEKAAAEQDLERFKLEAQNAIAEWYVVVRSGLAYGTSLSANHKCDLLPDFVIFQKGTDYDGTDQAVLAGFFDENWQVAERLIWHRGEEPPDPRLKKSAPEKLWPAEPPAKEPPPKEPLLKSEGK